MSVRPPILLAILGAVTFLIYLPGIGGPYLADDFSNIAGNRHLLLDAISWESLKDAAFSSSASPFHRPLSMLSFALSYTAAGNMEPVSAKLINILLHLCTGLLVYLVSVRLLRTLRPTGRDPLSGREPEIVALFTTAFWLLHPLFVSTVLYAVQRMSILSALFMLAGCLFYLTYRPRIADNLDCLGLLGGIAAFTTLAFLCKENGALLPGFLLLIELAVFRFAGAVRSKPAARAALAATLLAPTVFILLYLVNSAIERWDEPAPGYYFTIHERFLTQARVLVQYVGWLSLLTTEPMGLYHDDFPVSSNLVDPPTTLFALLFWIAAGSGAAVLTWQRRLLGFGLLWFLWGHALESTVLPLSIAFEHRNYLPGFGLLLGIVSALHEAMRHARVSAAARYSLLAAILALLPSFQTWERVGVWTDKGSFIAHSMLQQPGSALTLITVAAFLDSHGDPDAAAAALRAAEIADPRERAPVFARAGLHCEQTPNARFPHELREKLAEAGVSGLRTATARLHFVRMVPPCTKSAVNDDVLRPIYERNRRSRNENLAVSSLFGIGAVLIHRKQPAAAREAWQEAVDKYPQGEVIRPWLDELLRSTGGAPG